MANAESIARYLIFLASQGEEPSPVTHLQLQKLLYYAQGWSLGRHGRPLHDGTMEAWIHGPVVREVFPKFAKYKAAPIDLSEGRDARELTAEERGFARWIWENYGQYSPWRLREMTHAEEPWKSARSGVRDDEASRSLISHESLRSYFGRLHDEACKRVGLDPTEVRASRVAGLAGDFVDWPNLKASVGHGVANRG